MQLVIEDLVKLGPLPSSVNPDVAKLEQFQELLAKVAQPVSADDARALVQLFGPDECFGLAWTLLHLIESAPEWPILEALNGPSNEWIERLKQRAMNRPGK